MIIYHISLGCITYSSNTGSLAAKPEDFFPHFERQNFFFWQMFTRRKFDWFFRVLIVQQKLTFFSPSKEITFCKIFHDSLALISLSVILFEDLSVVLKVRNLRISQRIFFLISSFQKLTKGSLIQIFSFCFMTKLTRFKFVFEIF